MKKGMMVKTVHEPERMEYAVKKISALGFEITYRDKATIQFMFKGHAVRMFPYTGWHSGKSITDGRGIENLIKQLYVK